LLDASELVTAYALARPDSQWSVMRVIKDGTNTYRVAIAFAGSGNVRHFMSPVTATAFGPAQCVWHPAGRNGTADPDARLAEISGGAGAVYTSW
jgi:hypothetical protein